MDSADEAIIYLNPATAALKKLDMLDEDALRDGFNRSDLKVFTSIEQLKNYLLSKVYDNTNLLLMSSGNYDNMDLEELKSKFD